MSMPATPPSALRTSRLLLRPWQRGDAAAVREALDVSDAHLRPWIPFMKREPQSLEGTCEWIAVRERWFREGTHWCYAVMCRESQQLVGEAMLLTRGGEATPDQHSLEIGYWIDVRQIGVGYATEAAAAMVRTGFGAHGCDALRMVCDPRNAASLRVPKKLGFRHSHTDEGAYEDDSGALRDSMHWIATPAEIGDRLEKFA